MASGSSSSRGVSQPATDGSPIVGASQAPSGASLVEHADDQNSWRRMKADNSPWSQTDPLGVARFLRQKDSETKRSNAIAEVSALMCQQKCVLEECRFFCVEKPCLIVAGMAHTHLCAVHRDMRIEAQAARLENAIRDTRLREHLCEASRIGSAASSGIHWTRTEGAALYAAVKAGQDAFKRGATSVEVVAAIHAAGAKSTDP